MVRFNGKYVDIGNISGGSIEFAARKIINNQTQWQGLMHYNPWIVEAALQFLGSSPGSDADCERDFAHVPVGRDQRRVRVRRVAGTRRWLDCEPGRVDDVSAPA